MKKYYWKFPLDAYAIGPVEAKNRQEARRQAREWAGYERLPRYFQIWEA
jgi:hypothetical protein